MSSGGRLLLLKTFLKKNLDKKKDRSTAIDHVNPFSLHFIV
jgi:hypothetical protein